MPKKYSSKLYLTKPGQIKENGGRYMEGSNEGINQDDIIESYRKMAREKISEIMTVNEPLLGTGQGRLAVEEQLYGVLLQMLSYYQSNVHAARKEKQKQGIAAAKAAGVHFGRKVKYQPTEYTDVFKRYERGELTAEEARREIGACKNTFERMRKELKSMGLI